MKIKGKEIAVKQKKERYAETPRLWIPIVLFALAAVCAVLFVLSFRPEASSLSSTATRSETRSYVFEHYLSPVCALFLAGFGIFSIVKMPQQRIVNDTVVKVNSFVLEKLPDISPKTILVENCDYGLLPIMAAKFWPNAKVIAGDNWREYEVTAAHSRGTNEHLANKNLCEKNAASEGVGDRVAFVEDIDIAGTLGSAKFDLLGFGIHMRAVDKKKKNAAKDLLKQANMLPDDDYLPANAIDRLVEHANPGAVCFVLNDLAPVIEANVSVNGFKQHLEDLGAEDIRLYDVAADCLGSEETAVKCGIAESSLLIFRVGNK